MSARRRAPLLALVMTAGVARQVDAQPPSPRTQAWRFSHASDVTSTRISSGAPGLIMDVLVWNGAARVTFRGTTAGMVTGARGALLLQAGDTLMRIVNPDRREVLVLPAEQLGALLGGVPGGTQLAVSDVSSRVTRRGAGPRVEGQSTQHASVDQRFTLSAATETMRRTVRMEQHIEMDLSTGLSRLDRGFDAVATQLLRNLGVPPAAATALRALQRSLPPGFPVRSVTTAITVSGGDTLATTSTATISGLRQEAVDTTLFVVPRDYRVTELGRLLQPRRSP